jgi:hypothetical protein
VGAAPAFVTLSSLGDGLIVPRCKLLADVTVESANSFMARVTHWLRMRMQALALLCFWLPLAAFGCQRRLSSCTAPAQLDVAQYSRRA